MDCEDFDLESTADLFMIVADDNLRNGIISEEAAPYITQVGLEKLGLRAIELYCHVSSCWSDMGAFRGYLKDSPLMSEEEVALVVRGANHIGDFLRQDG